MSGIMSAPLYYGYSNCSIKWVSARFQIIRPIPIYYGKGAREEVEKIERLVSVKRSLR